jgi:hypothetical protein
MQLAHFLMETWGEVSRIRGSTLLVFNTAGERLSIKFIRK